VIAILIKSRDPSLKLEGLLSAQCRLPKGHSILSILAAKQSSVEAGIGGEERVAEVLQKYTLLNLNEEGSYKNRTYIMFK